MKEQQCYGNALCLPASLQDASLNALGNQDAARLDGGDATPLQLGVLDLDEHSVVSQAMLPGPHAWAQGLARVPPRD